MSLQIIIGTQWGDEGKGRIVDAYAAKADVVARFNGGDNAGHTVTVEDRTFKLHLIPSGIVHPHTVCVLGNGMVINPLTFLEEFESLTKNGITISPERLKISHAAHLITPAHRALDQAQEAALKGKKIGTTGRGIGPAYIDKVARRGIRAADLLDSEKFYAKLSALFDLVNLQLEAVYHQPPFDAKAMAQEFGEKALRLAPYVQDVGAIVRDSLWQGKNVLAEGAQGTLLDLEHGTYPFVTSSTTTAAGVFSGLGIGVQPVDQIIGVTKAFQTRVGAGPFPTELFDAMAERLRGSGANPWDEFGTTTGRPRRVGWLDVVLLRYAIEINGVTELIITKLDILSGIDTIRLCIGYRRDGKVYSRLPFGVGEDELTSYEPVYEDLSGWQEEIRESRHWVDLPRAARHYIRYLEELTGKPVTLVSVGPERNQCISVIPKAPVSRES